MGLVRQSGGILFPVLTIEAIYCDIELVPVIQAAPGYGVSIRVRAWDIKAFHAAGLAEEMLRCAGVESVLGQGVQALQQAEIGRWHDDMYVPAHRADRAVAVFHLECVGKVDFETHCAAMASARM